MPGLGIISGGSPIESIGGGCNNFTLTVEALAFINPSIDVDGGIGLMTSAANQEYLYKEGEEVVSRILPWISVPQSSLAENGVLPSLNITIDRSCCQDAIQISLVGEDIQDLAEYVPLNFEVPEGESAIMIPLVFSSEASFGPKIIGVQAIGCGQNKIKDLYFEYFNDSPCPDSVQVYASLSGSSGMGGTSVGLQFQLTDIGLISGDYEVELFKNGFSLGTRTGFAYSYTSLQYTETFDNSAYYTLDVKFTPWSFNNSARFNDCGDYCGSYSSTGSFYRSFTIFTCQPEPYYGSFAIGEDILGMFAIGETILGGYQASPGGTLSPADSPADPK